MSETVDPQGSPGPSARRVGVAHPGTQHSWQTALAFQEAGRLGWYSTSSYYQPQRWPDRGVALAPPPMKRWMQAELMRRRHPALDDDLIRRNTSTEALERILRRSGRIAAEKLSERRHRNFPNKVIALLKSEPVDILWSPHDCMEVFDWARPRGISCVLDQPIGHYASLDRVMREEYARHPDFFSTAQHGVRADLLERQTGAAKAADLVVVGSHFAAKTMLDNKVDSAKLRVVPYGYNDSDYQFPKPVRTPLKGRPIEFLFVGLVGARKGMAYLLEAFKRVDPAQARLTIVGPLDMPAETFARYADRVNYVGQVKRWEVAQYMAQADCFIFPSLFEGSALVLYEATGAGLGIIQTYQSGEGVRDGRNGLILAEPNIEALRQAIDAAIARPDMLVEWSNNAWAMRRELSWTTYRHAITEIV